MVPSADWITLHALERSPMEPDRNRMTSSEPKTRSSWGRTWFLVLFAAAVACALTYFLVTRMMFPQSFHPVELSSKEAAALEAKLRDLEPMQRRAAVEPEPTPGDPASGRHAPVPARKMEPLQPERYDESQATREISFSTREINALLARNTDLARKVAIDLSEDMASAKVLIPLDPDLPLLGGRTLKVTAGLELRYADQRPVIALKGVSIWGVPLPNAWLGGVKNVDLIQEFGMEKGFWNTLAAGVEYVRVSDGRLTLKLKE